MIRRAEELRVLKVNLTGGELPAQVMMDSIARLLPGVLKEGSAREESFEDGLMEYPQYTKPQEFQGKRVPDVLLSGNHEEIRAWRERQRIDMGRTACSSRLRISGCLRMTDRDIFCEKEVLRDGLSGYQRCDN